MKVTPNDIKSVLVKDEWIMQGLKYGQLSWTQTFNRMGKASPYKKIQNITLGKIAESAVLDYLKNKKIKYTLKGSTKWYEIDIDDANYFNKIIIYNIDCIDLLQQIKLYFGRSYIYLSELITVLVSMGAKNIIFLDLSCNTFLAHNKLSERSIRHMRRNMETEIKNIF